MNREKQKPFDTKEGWAVVDTSGNITVVYFGEKDPSRYGVSIPCLVVADNQKEENQTL